MVHWYHLFIGIAFIFSFQLHSGFFTLSAGTHPDGAALVDPLFADAERGLRISFFPIYFFLKKHSALLFLMD